MAALTARRPWPTAPRHGTAGPAAGPRREFPLVQILASPACEGLNPELFFPADNDPGTEAMAICSRCPARAGCLAGATARGELHGIWGGVNFALAGSRPRPEPGAGVPAPLPRLLAPMDKAAWLGKLRKEHRTVEATARAAGVSPRTAGFYLDLLELAPGSQDQVRAGKLDPAVAVAAVRAVRGGGHSRRRRAS